MPTAQNLTWEREWEGKRGRERKSEHEKERIIDSHKNIVFAHMFNSTKQFKFIPEEMLIFD